MVITSNRTLPLSSIVLLLLLCPPPSMLDFLSEGENTSCHSVHVEVEPTWDLCCHAYCEECPGLADPATALTSLVRHLNWQDTVLIYDSVHEKEATKFMSNFWDIPLTMYNIDANATKKSPKEEVSENGIPRMQEKPSKRDSEEEFITRISELLDNLQRIVLEEKYIHVVVICSSVNLRRVLSMMNDLDRKDPKVTTLHMFSQWLLVYTEMDGLFSELRNFLIGLHYIDHVTIVHLSTPCQQPHLAPSGWIEVPKIANCSETRVSTLYFGEDESRFLNEVAILKTSQEVMLLGNDDLFPNTKFGLNQRTLIVSVFEFVPFISKVEINNEMMYEGFSIDLLRELQAHLNFSVRLIELTDKQQWGHKLDNGSFTGVIGQLQRYEADIVVNPLAQSRERQNVVDFSYPFYNDYLVFLQKLPDPADSEWLTLIQPFKWEVHVLIWVSMLFISIFATLMERKNPYYNHTKEESALHFMSDSLCYVYGTLVMQGGEKLPRSTTGRTIFSCWWLFSIIMASTYSGNLIAFLTVSKDTPEFSSLTSVISQDTYSMGTTGAAVSDLFLKFNGDEFKSTVWKKILKYNESDPGVFDPDPHKHIEKVLRGKYIYVDYKTTIDLWKRKACNLRSIEENLSPITYSVGLVKGSPYKQMISRVIIALGELGMYHIWSTRWWPDNNFCEGKLVTVAKPISLMGVQSAFYMICIGIFLSAVALCVERLIRRKLAICCLPCRKKEEDTEDSFIHAYVTSGGNIFIEGSSSDMTFYSSVSPSGSTVTLLKDACSKDTVSTLQQNLHNGELTPNGKVFTLDKSFNHKDDRIYNMTKPPSQMMDTTTMELRDSHVSQNAHAEMSSRL